MEDSKFILVDPCKGVTCKDGKVCMISSEGEGKCVVGKMSDCK